MLVSSIPHIHMIIHKYPSTWFDHSYSELDRFYKAGFAAALQGEQDDGDSGASSAHGAHSHYHHGVLSP